MPRRHQGAGGDLKRHIAQLERADADILLTFKADGYVAATQRIMPTRDQTLAVTLDKAVGRRIVSPEVPVGRGVLVE